MAEHHRPPAQHRPSSLEAARGFVGRVSQLAAALRGEGAADAQAIADSVVAGLRARLTPGSPPLVVELTARGFAAQGADLALGDLVSAQLHSVLWAEGLRRVRIPAATPDDELVLCCDLLGQDWASRPGGFAPAAWALQLAHVHVECAALPIRTPLDVQAPDAAEGLRRLRAQLGLDATPAAAGLDEWLDAPAPALSVVDAFGPLPLRIPGAEPAHIGPVVAHAAVAVAQAVVAHAAARALAGVARGEPDALAWAHASISLLDPQLNVDEARLDAIGAGLEQGLGVDDGRLADALRAGVALVPAPEAWVRAAFVLAELVLLRGGPDAVARALRLGAVLPAGAPQQAVGDALALRNDAATIEAWLKVAAPDALPVVLRALRRHMGPTAVVAVSARVHHPAAAVREAALLCLRTQRGPRLTALMIEALDDQEFVVRREALRYLTAHREPDAVAAIGAKLARDPALPDARALVRALLVLTRGQAVPTLVSVAAQGGQSVLAVLEGLQSCGPAGQAALEQLGRSHPALRGPLRMLRSAAPATPSGDTA